MRRRPFTIWISIILVFASLPLTNRVFSQERPRLRVSTLFIGSSLLPFWIAQDQGHFNRAAVDVELIWMQSNLSTSALLAGEVDGIFGTPQVPLTVMSAKGAPNFVAIAAWASASEHWLVVNPAIKTVKELEGKVLATSRPKSRITAMRSPFSNETVSTVGESLSCQRADRQGGWPRSNRAE
jgi:ABC-type nitrate/sulfonate/bicarbonate transport system substrate-binding protein